MTACPVMSKRVLRPRSNMWICVASRIPYNVPRSVTVSLIRSLRASASLSGVLNS